MFIILSVDRMNCVSSEANAIIILVVCLILAIFIALDSWLQDKHDSFYSQQSEVGRRREKDE
jgi:ABC-type Fe3+ transport system permease subunit